MNKYEQIRKAHENIIADKEKLIETYKKAACELREAEERNRRDYFNEIQRDIHEATKDGRTLCPQNRYLTCLAANYLPSLFGCTEVLLLMDLTSIRLCPYCAVPAKPKTTILLNLMTTAKWQKLLILLLIDLNTTYPRINFGA